MKTQRPAGLLCPANAAHGPLLEVEGRLRCVHTDHDGRPSTHPQGPAPMTRSVFTFDEAISGQVAA